MRRWILVTRAPEQVAELAERMRERDIDVIPYPTLSEVAGIASADFGLLNTAAPTVAWIALTSPRAAAPLAAALRHAKLDFERRRWFVAALGEATAAAARAAGFRVDLVGGGTGEDLGARLARLVRAGTRVLFACGRDHRDELVTALESAGISVAVVPVYAMELTPPSQLPDLPDEPPTAVVLSSPRATEGYVRACGRRYAAVPHLAFGPTTASTAARLGLPAVALDQPTTSCIVEEVCRTS